MSADEKRSILVVDDDDVFRTRLARAFADRGLDAREARDGAAAVAAATADSPELAVVDLRMPDRSGLDVVRDLKTIDPTTSVVVLTGYGSIATALEAVKLGATHYLTKPANADEILAAFEGRKRAADSSRECDRDAPSLARMEWEHVQRILSDCSGNISQAARVLGLHRRSLQRKLSKRPVSR
jgi:two-component system response regulator RegA